VADVLDQSEIDALLAEAGSLAEDASDSPAGVSADDAAPAPSQGPIATLAPEVERELRRILHINVPIIVCLAERTMKMSEIIRLTTGAIIEFEKSADDDLEMCINNKRIGQGQAVKVSENFGLRITDIATVRDKIAALGNA